jgi:hypothetical protein
MVEGEAAHPDARFHLDADSGKGTLTVSPGTCDSAQSDGDPNLEKTSSPMAPLATGANTADLPLDVTMRSDPVRGVSKSLQPRPPAATAEHFVNQSKGNEKANTDG